MKSWIAKLRISAALDADEQPSARLSRWPGASAELRAIEQEMVALDRALTETAPKAEAPVGLHGSIMQSVRAAQRPTTAPRQPNLLRWLPAPALALILLVAAFLAMHRPARTAEQDAQSLTAATSALHFGNQMVQTMPSAMVAPLSDELNRLNLDLDKTAQFLLASLP